MDSWSSVDHTSARWPRTYRLDPPASVGQTGGAFATSLELYEMNYVGGEYTPDFSCCPPR